MSDNYREETLDVKCCPCPPECKIPVIVERILKPYFNPDGSPSSRKYYQYPITCFEAIHQTTDIFSPTLEDVIRRLNENIAAKQKKIAGGSNNVILTRGRDDGEVGELNKVDYLDSSRRSKVHVPSEYAVFKALDQNLASFRVEVDKEANRAQAAEQSITDMVRDEANRAQGVEHDLQSAVETLNRDTIKKDDIDDGMLLRDYSIDISDINNIRWKKSRTNIVTGQSEITEGSWTNLDDDISDIVDEKLIATEDSHPTVKQEIFDNTDGKTVANAEFVPGQGNLIGRFNVTRKNVNGVGDDSLEIVGFRSDVISAEVNDVMSNEKELVFSMSYNSMEDIRAAFTELYA